MNEKLIKSARSVIENLRARNGIKRAFVAMDQNGSKQAGDPMAAGGGGAPPGGAPGGAPPMDPSQGGGMPPGADATAQGMAGAPPGGDPSQGGGAPPPQGGDPSQGGGAGGQAVTVQLQDLVQLFQMVSGQGGAAAGGTPGADPSAAAAPPAAGAAPAPGGAAPAPAAGGGGKGKKDDGMGQVMPLLQQILQQQATIYGALGIPHNSMQGGTAPAGQSDQPPMGAGVDPNSVPKEAALVSDEEPVIDIEAERVKVAEVEEGIRQVLRVGESQQLKQAEAVQAVQRPVPMATVKKASGALLLNNMINKLAGTKRR